nr:hypothetical protein [uncultured Carboxylicivirga sp.]
MNTCKNCKTENEVDVISCTLCNYPIGGTEQDQAKYIAKQVMDRSDVDDAVKRLKNARILLFLIAGYLFIAPILSLLMKGMSLTLLITIILSGILGIVFLVFAILSFKRPKISILIPLVSISIYYLILLILGPYEYFYKGVLWKIIILVGLGYGYFSVRKSDKVLKGNKYLASLVGFSKIK